MNRSVPIVRVVMSDEEIEAQARAGGKSREEIATLMSDRETNRRAVQGAYDRKPPASRYVPPQE